MKKRAFAAVCLLAVTVMMTGCRAVDSSALTDTETTVSAAAPPPYTGPLYEISVTDVKESGAPDFEALMTASCASNFSGDSWVYGSPYRAITLWENFRENNTFEIWNDYDRENHVTIRKFCDADLQQLPIEGNVEFLASYNGYRMFLRDGDIEVYDPEMSLVSDTAGRFLYDDVFITQTYAALKSGWLGMQDAATSQYGFYNVYTQEWHPLDSESHILGGGMMSSSGSTFLTNSFYSEGLAYVTYYELARLYNKGTGASHGDRAIVGFLDETGEFAFRFDELEEFQGKLVIDATGFLDGTCMVAGRVDDGIKYGYTRDGDGKYDGVDLDFFYQIDTTGHVVKEIDYDTFVEFREKVLSSLGIRDTNHMTNYRLCQTNSIQLADGLTLRLKTLPTRDSVMPTAYQDYELVDINGTVYPLDDYHIINIVVGDDGTVLLECDSEYRWYGNSESYCWYRLNYQWIAPEGYIVPEDQRQNLSGEGLPSVTELSLPTNKSVQEIIFDERNLPDTDDMKLIFTAPGFFDTYQVQPEDYMHPSDGYTSNGLSLAFATLCEDEVDVSYLWTDDAGAQHYVVKDYSEQFWGEWKEVPVPDFLQTAETAELAG